MVRKSKRVYSKRSPYKKRYYKKRGALSKRNIFGRKTAKSQAKQIYALNKKINYIQKTQKPETRIYYNISIDKFAQSFTGDAANTNTGRTMQWPIFSLCESALQESIPIPMEGKLLRSYNAMLYFNMKRSDHARQNLIWLCRITILKLNKLTSVRDMQYIHYTNDPVNHTPYSDSGTYVRTHTMEDLVYGPLSPGVSSMGKIVYDKKIKVEYGSNAATDKQVGIKLPRFVLRKGEVYSYPDVMQGDYVICITYGFSPLNHTTSTAITVNDYICSTLGVKMAYTDQEEGDDANRYIAKTIKRVDLPER